MIRIVDRYNLVASIELTVTVDSNVNIVTDENTAGISKAGGDVFMARARVFVFLQLVVVV